jgi:hypothetical protein
MGGALTQPAAPDCRCPVMHCQRKRTPSRWCGRSLSARKGSHTTAALVGVAACSTSAREASGSWRGTSEPAPPGAAAAALAPPAAAEEEDEDEEDEEKEEEEEVADARGACAAKGAEAEPMRRPPPRPGPCRAACGLKASARGAAAAAAAAVGAGAGAKTRPDVKSTAAISFITSRLWAPTRIVDPIFISVYLTLRSRPSGLPSESKAQALPRRVAERKRARTV